MAQYRYYIVNDWIKMLDVRIQNKSPPIQRNAPAVF